jgi:hypothetical protein
MLPNYFFHSFSFLQLSWLYSLKLLFLSLDFLLNLVFNLFRHSFSHLSYINTWFILRNIYVGRRQWRRQQQQQQEGLSPRICPIMVDGFKRRKSWDFYKNYNFSTQSCSISIFRYVLGSRYNSVLNWLNSFIFFPHLSFNSFISLTLNVCCYFFIIFSPIILYHSW